MDRYGSWSGAGGEICVYHQTTGFDVVMNKLVGDGDESRGARKSLVGDSFGVTGNFSGPFKETSSMTTQNFAGSYTPKGAS